MPDSNRVDSIASVHLRNSGQEPVQYQDEAILAEALMDLTPEENADNAAMAIKICGIAIFSVMLCVISIAKASSKPITFTILVFMSILVVLSMVALSYKLSKQHFVKTLYAWWWDFDLDFSNTVPNYFTESRWFKCHRDTSGKIQMPTFSCPFLTVDHTERFVLFAENLVCLRNAQDIIDSTAFTDSEPALSSYLWCRVLRFVDRWKAGYFIAGKLDWRVNELVPIARILYLLRNETSIDVAIKESGRFKMVEFRPYSADLFESIIRVNDNGKQIGFTQIEKEIKDTYFELYFGLLQNWRHQNPFTVCGELIDALLRNEKPKIANVEEYENKFYLVFQFQGHLISFPQPYPEPSLQTVENHVHETHPMKFGFFKCFISGSVTLSQLLMIALCTLEQEAFCRMLANGEMRSVDFHKFCENYCAYANIRLSIFRMTDDGQTSPFQIQGTLLSEELKLILTRSDGPSAVSARSVYKLSPQGTEKVQNGEDYQLEKDDSSYII